MLAINSRNVHAALPGLVFTLFHSKPGTIVTGLSLDVPVALMIDEPIECLTFWAEAQANPFADLVAWMWEAKKDEPLRCYNAQTHSVSVNRFDLAKDSLSRICFLAEMMRQRNGIEPKPLTIFIGQAMADADTANRLAPLMNETHDPWCPYALAITEPAPIVAIPDLWDAELKMFIDEGDAATGYRNRFFRAVANPYLQVLRELNDTDEPATFESSCEAIARCKTSDWRLLGEQYLLRKWQAWQKKNPS